MHQRDFLIVGQGLAGSILAWELLKRDCKLLVIDPGLSNASRMAAGLINPVTGMRLVKTHQIELLLPATLAFYQNLQKTFAQTFYIQKPMLRILRNSNEHGYAKKRLKQTDYRDYLEALATPINTPQIHAPSGLLRQKQTGYLQTTLLLNSLKACFIKRQSFLQEQIDYQDFSFNQHSVKWKNIEFSNIIFCEGYQNRNNPWFSWLPMQPVKGEILTLQSNTLLPDKILNYGQWLIPINRHQFKLGATFDRENIDTQATIAGKNLLLDTLKTVIPEFEYQQITTHQAGIRACTLDKMPFIGRHPQRPQLTLFNGFGAKGSLLIPWYARKFADFLINGSSLDEQTNITRYLADYFFN